MNIKCKSGLRGWRKRLRKIYNSFEEFKSWAEIYGLHKRLGYTTPENAWKYNPIVEGSVIPSDYRRSKINGS